ncbi:extracellular catalytic domain type 1 short-chain-length polyhydroxyalkanoate depolymerase [Saccharomonospora xinjiangensis]|uniref:Esterase, PHB depolymerase family n=1 Tax=Saccharomonospora xinjiangensis XJ-54 TaxID=882086 RepID=I0V4Y4_9PSEU|nr:PHB depolymerase family esterase [Saccharomonospora xinjiangensis]EID55187.1 esterase, PHB depolymerase family [Saccharomonospora xinjiangensis XJ-54]
MASVRRRRLRRIRILLPLLAAVFLAASTTAGATTTSAAVVEVPYFGTNPGNLRMFQYVPDGLAEGRPVVVALHGCTQNATGYGSAAGWIELADMWRFSVVLPEQRSTNNANNCFNWFASSDTTRGKGEVVSVISMLDHTLAATRGDASRVYVTGLSAGGGMTSALLATYPDRFVGGGVVAGLPYRCASALYEAYTCMYVGKNLSPSAWGDLVRAASSHEGPWPTVSIWHGTADSTVSVANQRELVEQWTNVHGTDATADHTDTVGGHPRAVYEDTEGRPVVQTVTLTGMGHGQPVDPGTGEGQCGRAAPYLLDVDVCAAWHLGRWWGLD